MRKVFISLVWVITMALGGVASAQENPVVVELYTSQGCSSCPPADEMLRDLAGRDGVIALALHVDYWDYIGWADSFADPAYTARQQRYGVAAGLRMIYTPQFIIGGQDRVVGARAMDVADAIRTQAARPSGVTLQISRNGDLLQIAGQARERAPMVVQVVRYTPQESVNIERGENAGHRFVYANIVNDWRAVGEWDGGEPLDMQANVAGTAPIVVIVQERGPGRILAAAELR